MISVPTTLPHWLAAFVLLAAAHIAPWAAARLLGPRWKAPLDAGVRFADGHRLLGDHKTWRGVIAAGVLCAALAPLLGYSLGVAVLFAALAMGADCASSFLKRRLNLPPGREIPGLDQIPEALVPLFTLAGALGIRPRTAWILTGAFMLFDLAAQPLRHRRRAGRIRPPPRR